MTLLFYLIWFVLLMFGIYLRKKKIVIVPLWLEITSVILYLIIFTLIYFYPINKQNHPEKGDFFIEKISVRPGQTVKIQKSKIVQQQRLLSSGF